MLGGSAATVILNDKNIPEPDAFLAIDPKYGGRIQHDEKGYVFGAPELLAEISASSVADDLGIKKELYRKFGVNEYVVWRTKESAIDWFILRNDQFESLAAKDGVVRSEVFPGLWLAASALIAEDFTTVRQVLEEGLKSPEHVAFVEHLAKNKSA
ncbi:MAG: Uma2 family endonuclease [Gemmataceae bacterium]|nr:Uma2 family endonuclease [Gemmataceae bacterium]